MKDFIASLFAPIPLCPPDLSEAKHRDRFQCQKWYVRLWRYRHYLTVPYFAVKWWLKSPRKEPFSVHWNLEIAFAQVPMKWYYTGSETFGTMQDCLGKEIAEEYKDIFQ